MWPVSWKQDKWDTRPVYKPQKDKLSESTGKIVALESKNIPIKKEKESATCKWPIQFQGWQGLVY